MKRSTRPCCASRVAGQQLLVWLLEAAGVADPARALQAGRVAVNSRRVTAPQARADPLRDALHLDGQALALRFCRYLLFYKPYDVLSHFTARSDRPTLADYIPLEDVYAAGRLDHDSEGLLLLTDDGWLIHRLTHPRFGHPRTYLVQVEREPDQEALAALRRGVVVEERRTRPAEVERLAEAPDLPPRSTPIRYRKRVPTAWLRLTLREGRTRQVRRMTAAVGHPTLRLVRVAIGPLTLAGLAPGEWREIEEAELEMLQQSL
ncbi:MAG: pseudouridine synthase [Anaerolineae bacterium]|nr:pseudouridine synthase [Anaerolineae bacterium]